MLVNDDSLASQTAADPLGNGQCNVLRGYGGPRRAQPYIIHFDPLFFVPISPSDPCKASEEPFCHNVDKIHGRPVSIKARLAGGLFSFEGDRPCWAASCFVATKYQLQR
jgi:hypothetical protein